MKLITDIERAITQGRAPWTEIEYQTEYFWVFSDKYPVTEGHLLFVPAHENKVCIMKCYEAAYDVGEDGVLHQFWDGFNVGQNIGTAAGQTVMYPHIHLIPRRQGDMADPAGGIRHVIPEKGNYKKNA